MSFVINRSFLEGKKILNLGLSYPYQLPPHLDVKTLPIIKIQKHRFNSEDLRAWHNKAEKSDAWVFSSKTAVAHFFNALPKGFNLPRKIISVGQATTSELYKQGVVDIFQGPESTQEGMLQIIDQVVPKGSVLFWPRSKKARTFLSHQLHQRGFILHEMLLYSSEVNHTGHPVDLSLFDALLFTSSSTVEAYWELYGEVSSKRVLLCIGPITYQKLLEEIKKSCVKDLPEIFMLGELT